MHRSRWFQSLAAVLLSAACTWDARPPEPPLPADDPAPRGPVRRALLVGIDDYESQVPAGKAAPVGRGFRNLHGAARDARALREMLVERFDFGPENVLILTDAAATRQGILAAFESHLVAPARPGDTVVFYFGGHGSQRLNTRNEELDKLDETLVPVDAGRGVDDIRDKELRRLLNDLIDRGASPTVLLDSCHSGSGARGYPTGIEPRALAPVLDDIAIPGPYGPDPAERGALILSAARADEFAWETRDSAGMDHGAFSWALLQALRDVVPGEAAEDTFQRVRGRLHQELRRQEPVLEGTEAVRRAPLFAAVGDPTGPARSLVAVERVEPDGSVIVQAGWVHGLSEGSRLSWATPGGRTVDLEIVQMLGLSRCRARVLSAGTRDAASSPGPSAPTSGTLLEVTAWAAPMGKPLRVWIPAGDFAAADVFVRDLRTRVAKRGISWVEDPTAETPTHVLRPRDGAWELAAPGQPVVKIGPRPSIDDILSRVPKNTRLFAQLPAPQTLVESFQIGPGTPNDGIELTENSAEVAAVLVGRQQDGRTEFAWLQPDSVRSDSAILPVATPWRDLDSQSAAHLLRDDLFHLRKIQGWLSLESPPTQQFGYQLELRAPTETAARGEATLLRSGENLELVLAARPDFDLNLSKPRYVYVFSIDSQGNSVLLFGLKSDENPQPFGAVPGRMPPSTKLGKEPLVRIVPPFGRDHYVLLTSDEPLFNPWVLEYRGFRPRGPRGASALEELLSLTGGTRAAERALTTAHWSIERRSFVSGK